MANDFQMTVGQAHELDLAFRRNDWDAEFVKKLAGRFARPCIVGC